ncbi:MAG: VWA domain-containing protein [Rhodobacteraceae bacterium]|nr:VWA domain-containing protein [Paracoccaceae bacterium]
MNLPAASNHLIAFGRVLRGAGFLATPDQGISLLQAVAVLGPKAIGDIRRAARAVYGPGPARAAEFDTLFDAHFLGLSQPALAEAETAEEIDYNEDQGGAQEPMAPDQINEAGQAATRADNAGQRALAALSDDQALRRFRALAPHALPQRRTRRARRARRGTTFDMRRALRQAVRFDGEVLTLPRRRRRVALRPILLLIDISGSMKGATDGAFRFAHALMRLDTRVEVFTLGTRLSRVTRALALRNRAQALARASALIADWDGGTRLGDTLGAFLAVPRLAGLARGAFVVTLSDGLERGAPEALVAATTRLGRLCWQHLWLTPLATGPGFRPQTEAMGAIHPYLDGLGSAASVDLICRQVLGWAKDRTNETHSPIKGQGK